MYTLIVLKELTHPDGRLFLPGHDCNALSGSEVRELIENYPDYFEGKDDLTKEYIEQLKEGGK